MSEWFQSKVKFLRQMDNGLIKAITEQYLVNSMSFTECEARVLSEQGEGVREVTCQAIARSNIKEVVFYGDTDLWWKTKVTYNLMDEDTEKEKKVTTYLLVNANDLAEADARTKEHLREFLVPFEIVSIASSPIIDVYDYKQSLRPRASDTVATDLKSEATAKADGEEEECAMEGSAVAYSSLTAMLLDFGLDKLALWRIEKIKHVASSQPLADFHGWLYVHYGALTDEQATQIYEWCANDAAFEDDEESGETDLEGRMDAAFARQIEID